MNKHIKKLVESIFDDEDFLDSENDIVNDIINTKNSPTNIEDLVMIIKATIEKEGWECNLNGIDVSHITNMKLLFSDGPYGLKNFNGDISKWDVSHVTNMQQMFAGSNFNGDISEWDVSNVNNMMDMFCGSSFNQDISNWNVMNVMLMNTMFAYSEFNQDLSNWKISKYCNTVEMFDETDLETDNNKWPTVIQFEDNSPEDLKYRKICQRISSEENFYE